MQVNLGWFHDFTPYYSGLEKQKYRPKKSIFNLFPIFWKKYFQGHAFQFLCKVFKIFFSGNLFDFTNLCFLQEDKEVNMKEDILAVAKFDKQFNDTYRAYLDQQDDSYVMADEEIITVKESLVWKYV